MRKLNMTTTITAAHGVKETGSQILHDGGTQFCTSCNVALDHTQQATVQRHLQSESHHSRKRASDTILLKNKQAKKQATISSLKKSTAQKIINWLQWNLDFFLKSGKIPLAKLDHPKLRVFIQHNVQSGDYLPSANKL
ncbi:CGG triplet repeat-binding protein 1-like [Heterodontus francisci]|uniref:CGG triplet repeat-binding protein 1-like n=1 Tax=Heterodontus francisci TaxID=7792 RepID=UPI00355C3409